MSPVEKLDYERAYQDDLVGLLKHDRNWAGAGTQRLGEDAARRGRASTGGHDQDAARD